jgi:hypothetical protein
MAVASGHALAVERAARHALGDVRPFVDLHEGGKHPLPGRIEQKAALAVLAAAADGADETLDQAAGHLRIEHHRGAPGREAPRAESRQRILRCVPADRRRVLQVHRIPGARVPEIPLHFLILARQQHAADRVRTARVAGQEAVRVAVHPHTALVAHRGTLGIGEARVDRHAGRLATTGQLHRLFRIQVPAMVQIQVRHLARQVGRIRQSRAVVFGGVARDGAGLRHRGAHGGRGQVPGARRALALAEVHGQTQSPVALVLDGIDLAEAHGGREPPLQAGIGLALGGAGAPRFRQDQLDDLCQLGDPGGVDFLLHMPCRCVGAEL